MKKKTLLTLTLFIVSGCASEAQMRDYTLGLPVDDGILALNLTEVAEAEIDMNTVGQLVTSKSAIFASSDGGLFKGWLLIRRDV